MLIEVLGLPNEATAALDAALAEALARLGIEGSAQVDHIADVGAMIARGERRPPALRVDGTVVCRRSVPSVDEIVSYLRAAQEASSAAWA
jgi:hypothetical protein